MNKLLVVEDKKIKSGEIDISYQSDSEILIAEENILHDYNNSINELKIKVLDKAKLDYYQVKDISHDYHLTIEAHSSSIVNYYVLFRNRGKNKVVIDVILPSNAATVKVYVRALNVLDNSNLDIICNGIIKKDTKDNVLTEDLKGLITGNDDTIKISPIMMVDTNEVMANHLVTVGSYNKEELFYLLMHGLSDKTSKELLKKAFMYQKLSSYLIKKIEAER